MKNAVPFEPDFRTQKGFEETYNAYSEKLCGIALNLTRDRAIAENIVHDVFFSLWKRRTKLVLQGPIGHYLTRAVKLSVMEFLRNKELQNKKLECLLYETCRSNHCTENAVNFSELSTKVDQLVDQLPCQCKEVYTLSRIKGMTNKEIGSCLLISERTVEAHLYKALKYLKANLRYHKLTN